MVEEEGKEESTPRKKGDLLVCEEQEEEQIFAEVRKSHKSLPRQSLENAGIQANKALQSIEEESKEGHYETLN